MFNEIQEFYFGKKSVADNIPELIQFMSDDFMVYDIIRCENAFQQEKHFYTRKF